MEWGDGAELFCASGWDGRRQSLYFPDTMRLSLDSYFAVFAKFIAYTVYIGKR